ncbi:MAG: hypothetical protein ACRDTG_12620 [Pseudonocardiaceae bacterium]
MMAHPVGSMNDHPAQGPLSLQPIHASYVALAEEAITIGRQGKPDRSPDRR